MHETNYLHFHKKKVYSAIPNDSFLQGYVNITIYKSGLFHPYA